METNEIGNCKCIQPCESEDLDSEAGLMIRIRYFQIAITNSVVRKSTLDTLFWRNFICNEVTFKISAIFKMYASLAVALILLAFDNLGIWKVIGY